MKLHLNDLIYFKNYSPISSANIYKITEIDKKSRYRYKVAKFLPEEDICDCYWIHKKNFKYIRKVKTRKSKNIKMDIARKWLIYASVLLPLAIFEFTAATSIYLAVSLFYILRRIKWKQSL